VGWSVEAALPPALGGAGVFGLVITIRFIGFLLRGICRVRRNEAGKPSRSGKMF
jgi:hypothetical protein